MVSVTGAMSASPMSLSVAPPFINPRIAPSRIATPYVAGHFQKPGGQLYVNRGIGTIFVPIRLGAPPELTVYRLSCG